MPYAQIDTKVRSHPKFLKAGALASWLWHLALYYCIEHQTDGVLTRRELHQLSFYDANGRRLDVDREARRLRSVKLFEPTRGGWRIHDYSAHNLMRTSIKRRNAGSRFRKQLYAHPDIVKAKRDQAKGRCQCCGAKVSWTDRRGRYAASFQIRNSKRGITLENIYVACRGCLDEGRLPMRRTAERRRKSEGRKEASSGTSSELGRNRVRKYGSTRSTRSTTSSTTSRGTDDQKRTDPSVHPGTPESVNPLKKAVASPRSKRGNGHATESPSDNIGVITRIAHEVLDSAGVLDKLRAGSSTLIQAMPELAEDVKRRCATLDIRYNSEVVGKALDSAIWQRNHPPPAAPAES